MDFVWQVVSFDTKDETNFEGDLLESAVSCITWKRSCTSDSGSTVAYLGKTNVSAFNDSLTDYVAYESITPTIALDWVLNTLTEEDIARIDEVLIVKINRTELVTKNPPWINTI